MHTDHTITSPEALTALLPDISGINLFVNRVCNLDCSYCYVNKTGGILDPQTARASIRYSLPHIQKHDREFHFGFLGGEPLLSLPLIDQICREVLDTTSAPVSFGVTTNGTLLNERHLAVLQKYNFRVVLSLDGGPDAMANRFFKATKKNPYDAVVAGLAALQDSGLSHLIQMTVTPDNVMHFFENVVHVVNLGVRNIIFGFDFCGKWNLGHVARLRSQMQLVLRYYFDLLSARKDVHFKFIDNEVVGLLATHKKSYTPLPFACNAAVRVLAIDQLGNIFPCQNFVNYPHMSIGDVTTGIDKKRLETYLDQAQCSVAVCATCSHNKFCRRCPAANIARHGDIAHPVAICCEVGKLMYDLLEHALPDMLQTTAFRHALGGATLHLDRYFVSAGYEDHAHAISLFQPPTDSLNHSTPKESASRDSSFAFTLCGAMGPEEHQSYLLSMGNRYILMDCGHIPSNLLPPSLCIITHGHSRNTAAIIDFMTMFPSTPIIATAATIDFIQMHFPQQVLSSRLISLDATGVFEQDGIHIQFIPAGHIAGNTAVILTVEGYKLLCAPQTTGNRMNGQLPGITDMNSPLFQDLDVAVLDGTLLHSSAETVQEESGLAQFIASVRAAVDQQHRVLITSSAIGRAQILMQAVAAARRDGRLPKDLRLYCSPKVKAAHQIYLSHGNTDRMESSYGVWQEGQILKPGCVILAESRCLFPDTIARKVYDRLYDKQDVTILVTGNAVEDSPLMHLLAHHKGLHDYKNKFPLDLSNIRATIVWIPFADHAQNHELVALIERMPQSCRLWFLDGDGQPQPLSAVAQTLLTPGAALACRPLTVHRISGTVRRPGKVVWMRGGSGITIDHLPELTLDHRTCTRQQGNENVIEFGGYRTLTLKQEGE